MRNKVLIEEVINTSVYLFNIVPINSIVKLQFY